MVQGDGGHELRWSQVYRRGCREECMDALTASAEPEADIRHGGERTWCKALVVVLDTDQMAQSLTECSRFWMVIKSNTAMCPRMPTRGFVFCFSINCSVFPL